MVEALRIFDHYHFRVSQRRSKKAGKLLLQAPARPGDVPWWKKDYTDARRIRDRELFA